MMCTAVVPFSFTIFSRTKPITVNTMHIAGRLLIFPHCAITSFCRVDVDLGKGTRRSVARPPNDRANIYIYDGK